jgi:hypothetical protein
MFSVRFLGFLSRYNSVRGQSVYALRDPGVTKESESECEEKQFLTTDGQDLHGWAEKRKAMLGQAKLALCFQIPSQASLSGILKPYRSFCYANGPSMPHPEFSGKKHGVALALQAGRCFEKASASPLASVFSTTNPAFAQRTNPVIFYPCISELSVVQSNS